MLAGLAELARRSCMGRVPPKGRNQSVNQSRNFPALIHQFTYLSCIEVPKIACQLDLGLQLIKRPSRISKKMSKL